MSDSSNFEKNELVRSLNIIGIKDLRWSEIEICRFSPANKKENNSIYKSVNERLLEIADEEKEGEFIHITGEMKALTDPFHRKCIKKLYENNKQIFKIIFSLPPNYLMNEYYIKKYNIETWEKSNWVDHIESFDILGENISRLYNNYERELIQYSLFGDELILFQSVHQALQYIKKVWIIESKYLFKKLLKNFERVLSGSQYINPLLFNQFNSSLSSNFGLNIISLLYDINDIIEESVFLEELKKNYFFNEYVLNNLYLIGFIEKTSDNFIKLSDQGNEYLNLFF